MREFILIITVTVVGIFSMSKKRIIKWLNVFLWLTLLGVFGQFVIRDLGVVRGDRPVFMLRNVNLDYNSKMEMKIGKVSYDYILFIKDNTSENTTILIPPQAYPWYETSNIAYMRYFLFPRNLINGDEKDPKVDIKSVDYVLIDYGETTVSQYGYTNVWPKFNVEGKYIIYWDPQTGAVRTDKTGIYKYVVGDNTEKWGLIKIEK